MPEWLQLGLSVVAGLAGAWAFVAAERRRRDKDLVASAQDELGVLFRLGAVEAGCKGMDSRLDRFSERYVDKELLEEKLKNLERLGAQRDRQLDRALEAMERISGKLGELRNRSGSYRPDRES